MSRQWRNQVDTRVHANLRVSARVYDSKGGEIFSKNRFFGTTHGDAWGPRSRSPSLIMAPGVSYRLVCSDALVAES